VGATAGNGLGTTPNNLRGAAGNGRAQTMKYLRRTTISAAGRGLGTSVSEHSPAVHNERRHGQRPGRHGQVPATHYERRRGQRPGETIKYLRCITSGAAGGGLGNTAKYLLHQNAGAGNNCAKAHLHKSLARIQMDSACCVAAFDEN
jgi:hypothetical protein